MKRREFVVLAGATAAWPLTARAQQAGKLPVIGFLGATTPQAFSEWTAAFEQRLRELGWVDGRTVAIEYRWGNGRIERFGEIAAEFVRLKVDVIVTSGTPAIVAAKDATTIIPIVFGLAGDPVATGLVASLSHPGGNVTGLSVQTADVIGKRFDLLRQIVPSLRRLAVFANADSALVLLEVRDIQATARTLGIEVAVLDVRRAEDIEPVFTKLNGNADALYVCADPLVNANRERINALALAAHLPTMHDLRDYAVPGGLMSYGSNIPDLFRRTADYVDKILHGTKPADLPVEQPTKFDLVISLRTAKALKLSIPPTLLALADEVIE